MNIHDQLQKLISDALVSANIEYYGEIVLDYPADLSRGDFATPIALKLSKQLGQNPQEIAEKIISGITIDGHLFLDSVEVAGPGFINFTLAKTYWKDLKQTILKQREQWGTNELLKGEQVITEYTDPNPFKTLHIGHLMSNAIGESISRINEAAGAQVVRCNYQGDVGMHVASALWGLQKLGIESTDADRHGEAYAFGSTARKENESAAEEIKKINKLIYSREDAAINKMYDEGRQASLDRFETIYNILGTKFVNYFFESITGPKGKDIVLKNSKTFPESDGARIFNGEEYGLHTRVFVNKEGLPTYEAKELGLEKIKHEMYPNAQKYIIITGNEIDEYFKVLIKALESVVPEINGRVKHIGHGMMQLSSGKMSSRTGKVVTGEGMIFNLRDAVLAKMTDREINDKKNVAQKIAIAAIKFSVLRVQSGKDIKFDEEESISFEGTSGPYIQYSYVRAVNALAKARDGNVLEATQRAGDTPNLERMLVRYPATVIKALADNSPHHIAGYLFELAAEFNSFYAQTKIVDESNPDMQSNVQLTQAFAVTIKNGLDLLGIQTVEQM